MKRTIKVCVDELDIATGVRGSARNCPLAVAISRAAGVLAYVGTSTVSFDDGPVPFPTSKLPKEAFEFRHKFDHEGLKRRTWYGLRGPNLKPFSFELEV